MVRSMPDSPQPEPTSAAPTPAPGHPPPPPPEQPAVNALTPEEQMALFEQELKETDWGHQPC